MSPDLGCDDVPYARSPHIDRLASQGVRYTNAFASAPVCSPARSCLITGLYATSLGTPNLRSRFPIPATVRGFPAYLREAGYFCTNNVKTDYNTSDEQRLIQDSWDECSTQAHWRHRRSGQPFFAVFNDMTTHQSRSAVWPYEQFVKEVQSRLPADQRHDPAQAPVPPYYPDTPTVRRTIARYHDCISVMDQNVGALLRQLEEDGLSEETIVFFYSDHGAGLPRHKRLLLDSGLHVPLIARFPKRFQHLAPAPPGSVVDRLVSFVDFAPTVLSLAGLPIPDVMQGRAFLGPEGAAARERVYGARDRVDEAYDLARSVRDERFLYVRTFMPHLGYNQPSNYCDQGEIRQEITRLESEGHLTGAQEHYAGPRRPIEELYDAVADPQQTRNLAGDPEQAPRLEAMRAQLRAWMVETRDLGLLPEEEMARRMEGSTPFAVGHDPKRYPLERVLEAADRVGRGAGQLSQLTRSLDDPDPAVRYWSAVGLNALAREAAPAADALANALEDASAPVRIESATALCRLGQPAAGLAALERDLLADDLRVVLRAARALELLGEIALPALATMENVLATARKQSGDPAMFVRFALEPAVKALAARGE